MRSDRYISSYWSASNISDITSYFGAEDQARIADPFPVLRAGEGIGLSVSIGSTEHC